MPPEPRKPPVGRMREVVRLQEQVAVSRDDFGGVSASSDWTTVATRFARVEPLAGQEVWSAQHVRPDVSHRVTMRYVSTATPKYRILWGSRVLEIAAVLPDEKREWMTLACVEQL